ncbi:MULTISPECIES: class I SAM-dependent methyltransferase [unclassified Clostridium]|uniref:class I SAM-dependent methyltransferase n=1 Tax=unclassified Clostridium TaxID=2614128 RepID=UPI0002985891|nr:MULTISPECIES: class I SAM-dependent methyltransferase [unclassified Clostridium]EKQ53077.1 MAG: methylase involved in ubiquinone/menaquinone biosynthesis [Clostridium sp. Maddingley MBC34-26]
MKQSKEYFDQIASNWDNMRNDFFSDDVRLAAYKAANIEKGKIAADMGAGTGYISEGLIQKNIKVLAVDQSEEMLNLLKEKFSYYKELKCIQGVGENIPIEDDYVDYVFANMFLHHVENPSLVIKEMYRILKSGGKLVITDLDQHNFEFLKTEQYDVWMGFDRKKIIEWFKDAGLQNVTINCVGSNCCSDSNSGCEKASISIFIAYGEKNI